jgi:hypothetical protein
VAAPSPDVSSGQLKVVLAASTAGAFRLSAIRISSRIRVRLRPRLLEAILTTKLPLTTTKRLLSGAESEKAALNEM